MKKKYAHKHKFAFKIQLPNGEWHVFEYKAKIKTPPKAVRVSLKAQDADKAIENQGCGNSQLCAMSTAISRQKHLFPHPVLGIVDYHNRTVYVASKRDKAGAIVECYRYMHTDNIAKRNDSPGELKKLANELHQDGAMSILLSPRSRSQEHSKREGHGRRTGERSSIAAKGDKLRYAVAQGGRFPNIPAI